MSMKVISEIVEPVSNLIDDMFTSDEERGQGKLAVLQERIKGEIINMQSRMNIIMSEAQGESWLQRSWRPITMIVFLIMICAYWFGFAPDYLLENPNVVLEVFGILKIGIGGYIGSRGVEKVAKTVAPIFKSKKLDDFQEKLRG